MKKLSVIVLLLSLLLGAAACTQTEVVPTQSDLTQAEDEASAFSLPPGADVFYGMIVADLGNTLLVTKNETEGKTSGLYTLSAQYLDSKQDASVLVPGAYFTLHYGGFVMESYPMQFGNPIVFTCDGEKEDLVTPLTEFIFGKIASDVKWLALDLSAVDGLSDGEREAVFYLLEGKTAGACSIVHFDPSVHSAQDLLQNETSPADGAVLSVEAQLQNGKLVGTWRLTDTKLVTEGEADISIPYYLN